MGLLATFCFAAAAVGATAAVRAVLAPWLGAAPPFVFFTLPVFLIAWHRGLRAGLLATGLSLLAGWYVFVPPAYSMAKGNADIASRCVLFTAVGVGISILSARLKRSQVEGRRSERRFQNTFENAAVGMAHVGLDGRWLRVNQRLCEILGQEKTVLIGRDWSEFAPPDGTSMGERAYQRGDGQTVWLSVTTSVQPDEAGTPELLIAVVEDISSRKFAEEGLRVNLRQLQSTFEGMVEPALLTDAQGKIVAINSAYLTLFDLDSPPRHRDELLSEVEFLTKEGEPVPAGWSPFLRASAGEIVRTMEAKARNRRTGKVASIVAGSAPVRDACGNVAAVILTVHDMTEQKKSERALERSNQALRQFAYAAAHDLQEPLRNVTISSELLVRRYSGKWDGDADRLLGTNVEGGRRMQSMVRDLLEYTKVIDVEDAGAVLTDAGTALARALANLQQAMQETGSEVTTSPLPKLCIHETHLVQLFQNLISNSLKYRKAEAGARIRVSAREDRDQWVVLIEDDGIGFEASQSERIFGLFKRLHERGEYPGTGIGLAICMRIVEHYGGRIWAEGRVGEGARFYFSLRGEAL